MSNYQTYMSHETWWNSLRMTARMHRNILKIILVLDLLAVGLAIVENDAAMYYLKQIFEGFIESTMQWFKREITNQGYLDNLTSLLHYGVLKFRLYGALFVGFLAAGYVVVTALFRRKAKSQGKPRFIRGARLKSIREVNRSIAREKETERLRLGGLAITEEAEIQHTVVVGATGSGKTSGYFAPLSACLMEQGQMGLVHCAKGDYTARFLGCELSRGINLLYNPLDRRSLKWTVFNDLKETTDIERVANHLIPVRDNHRDPTWDHGARHILTGLLHYAHNTGRTRNADLWRIFTSPIAEKLEMLKATEYGFQGRDHLADPNSKQAQSYNSVFMLYISAFRFMDDGAFSIRRWIEKGTPGFIFATNNVRFEDTLRPALTLFINVLAAHLLAMVDDPDRRVFFLLDEFTSLNSLPSIVQILKMGRSKGAAVSIGVQEFGQIEKVYGRGDTRTILGNINNIVAMRTRDVETAGHLSDLFGETEVMEADVALSAGVEDNRDGLSLSHRRRKEPLALPSEIQTLGNHEAYVLLANHGLTKTRMKPKGSRLSESGKKASRAEPFVPKDGLSLDRLVAEQQKLKMEADVAIGFTEDPNRGREVDMGPER